MNQSDHIIQVSLQSFGKDVVERSQTVPVLLEFYAQDYPPSQQLAPLLRRLADEYQGKFILARANAAEVTPLIQQLDIRGLPTLVMVHQGQIARTLGGPQSEADLRQLLDEFTKSRLEQIRGQVDRLLEAGDFAGAVALLRELAAAESGNLAVRAELADLLILQGQLDEAEELLAGLPTDEASATRPRYRLEFVRQAAELPKQSELEASCREKGDVESRFRLAIAQVADQQLEAALENLLQVMQQDRAWGDDAARLTMIKALELFDKGSPVASAIRRRMFNLMH